MSSSRPTVTLFSAAVIIDVSSRAAFVALPLIVLSETGSAALTGVVSGAMALPLLLSPWWARRLRHAAARPAVLAALTLLEAAGALLVPIATISGHLTAGVLIGAGLVSGAGRTLTLPGRQTLLAELEQERTGSPVRILAWQEAASRATSIVGPAVGALVVAAGYGVGLLFAEAAAISIGALLTLTVRGPGLTSADHKPASAPKLRTLLRRHPDIRAGWIIRATAGATWFAFSLGLAIQGELQHRPGYFYAIGLSSYALGAVIATLTVGRFPWVAPSLTLAALGWTVNGAAWVLMGIWPDEWGYAIGGLVGGSGAAVGFATITRLIAERTEGPDRGALLSGQLVVVESGTAVGMFAGGSLIELWGIGGAFVITGAVLTAVALLAPLVLRSRPRGSTANRRRPRVLEGGLRRASNAHPAER
ncbi:MFS family permease [Arthrobacter woluwensis]|uniref:MFS transporter n=1 Tax=Arthrobacter woluwensis TaxID=156980 RepID=UPI00277F96D7|nr:MFS transporter [Arthrobacter woluwensis]MDQ0709858.1 MFS family permease [Arthrobacter woluwensis]